MSYSVIVEGNNLLVNTTTNDISLSLSRTGGQGSKGDSVSNVYLDGNNDFIVEISNSANEVVSTINLGGSNEISLLYDFQSRYVGVSASEPTLDGQGNPLLSGALYFNTTTDQLGVYDGVVWAYPALDASNSASAASTSETNASNSASGASTSETNAATSAANAATSEANAATSETNAATSETNAAASYDAFDDRYLGSKASDPTLDNDGDALLTGALYWNTVGNNLKAYTGTTWVDSTFIATDAETLDGLDSTQFLRSDDVLPLPTIRPSLNLDFANTNYLDSRITFSRNSTATYYDQFGTLQTAAIGEARFDHDPATGEAKGLLIEEQRTNLLTYSEQFDNAAWTKTRSSISADATTAPDGNLTADKLIEDTTASSNHIVFRSPSLGSAIYTFSAYFKAAERTEAFIRIDFGSTGQQTAYFNLSTGAVGALTPSITSSIEDIGDGWYRCSVTNIAADTVTNVVAGPALTNSNIYTGDGTSGIYVWGAQLEAGAFPTSYIKTEASTVTRVADDVSMTGTNFSDWYNQSAGTFIVGMEVPSNADGDLLSISGSTDQNRIDLTVGSGNISVLVGDGGATQTFLSNNTAVPVGACFKAAFRIAASDYAFWVNGALIENDTATTTVPTVDRLAISNALYAGSTFKGSHIKTLSYYPRGLTNAELVALTEV